MAHLYIDSILAGLIFTNGIPHFIKGIFGKKFPVPFVKDSSPSTNVIWGWVNFAVGGVLIYYAHPRAHYLRAFAAFSVGVLITALVLSSTVSKVKD
ncbi:MAG TPA: hypothetical protein VLF63_03370 [Patescibacteria group bacterium]|nr:hypothetical protein [Patescibacteria group bacterium]